MSSNKQNKNYKVVLIGDGGVGKTSYLKRLLNGEFEKRYLATLGVEVTPIKFNTNNGEIIYSVWDTAGQQKFGGLRNAYYEQADAAIIFCDLTSKITFKNVKHWFNDFKQKCPNGKVIVVGNKSDIKERKVSIQKIERSLVNIPYFDISAKSCSNFEAPFLELSQYLTQNKSLQFVDEQKASLAYSTNNDNLVLVSKL
jgi:GTP-binding nuclear protein Ran